MRMAELAMRSGVARETIHFYLREGLLPRPQKMGRTVAYYDEGHLERLRTIRRLREEKYLPIAVIRRLLDSPAAAAERDLDALAEVLHIVPRLGENGGGRTSPPPPSPEALRAAFERGLLGARRDDGRAVAAEGSAHEEHDPAERRVLAIVDDALALGPSARALTLDDLTACAADLTALVAREATLFFDAVFRSGDVGGSIAALREGRGTVARFITAYRDLMLRRIVEDLLVAIERGPDIAARAATVPLSAAKERELGVIERRAELYRLALEGPGAPDTGACLRLVWHLFACGAAPELASLPPGVALAAGPRAAVLVAWGAYESARSASSLRALRRASEVEPGFALGHLLAGEAAVARGLRRRDAGASLLEEVVPALHRIVTADPGEDGEPAARVLGCFHRGRFELALPPVLGRGQRGAEALLDVLRRVEGAEGADLDPAAIARIKANAWLALGRHSMSAGDPASARELFLSAMAVDPEGPIGDAARGELARGGPSGLR